MGYSTIFTIRFSGFTNRRLASIIETVLKCAFGGASEKKKYIDLYKKEGVLKIEAKWYTWRQDIQSEWYSFFQRNDAESKDSDEEGEVRGISLKGDEVMYIEGTGQAWEDRWRAIITSTSSVIQSAKVTVTKTNPRCIYDESDDELEEGIVCKGCDECGKLDIQYPPLKTWPDE